MSGSGSGLGKHRGRLEACLWGRGRVEVDAGKELTKMAAVGPFKQGVRRIPFYGRIEVEDQGRSHLKPASRGVDSLNGHPSRGVAWRGKRLVLNQVWFLEWVEIERMPVRA